MCLFAASNPQQLFAAFYICYIYSRKKDREKDVWQAVTQVDIDNKKTASAE